MLHLSYKQTSSILSAIFSLNTSDFFPRLAEDGKKDIFTVSRCILVRVLLKQTFLSTFVLQTPISKTPFYRYSQGISASDTFASTLFAFIWADMRSRIFILEFRLPSSPSLDSRWCFLHSWIWCHPSPKKAAIVCFYIYLFV